MNPSLIDARGYVTDEYLIAIKTPPQQQQPQQQPTMAPAPINSSLESSITNNSEGGVQQAPQQHPHQQQVSHSSTAPELSKNPKKLPPIVKSSTAQNLTLTNVGIHNNHDNEGEEVVKIDLDQTTMIGSALDLDSIESDRENEELNTNSSSIRAPSHAGSQVGLLKLSAV